MFAELHPAGTVHELATACICTSFDHSDGCDIALLREGDKNDLEKNDKTAVDQKNHLLTEEDRVDWW